MLRTTTRHSALLCLAAPLALTLAACDQQQGANHTPPNDTTASDVGREMDEAAEATGEYMENQYAALKAEIDQGVENVNEQIVILKAKASEASGDTKTAINDAIASLEEQRDALMDNLEDKLLTIVRETDRRSVNAKADLANFYRPSFYGLA